MNMVSVDGVNDDLRWLCYGDKSHFMECDNYDASQLLHYKNSWEFQVEHWSLHTGDEN